MVKELLTTRVRENGSASTGARRARATAQDGRAEDARDARKFVGPQTALRSHSAE